MAATTSTPQPPLPPSPTAPSLTTPSPPTPSPPTLHVNGAPQPSSSTSAADLGGKRAELRMAMLKRLRPLPLRHEWVFWYDKNTSSTSALSSSGSPGGKDEPYEAQLNEIAQMINTIQAFWQVFNNMPLSSLKVRDSLHLFKKNVKPVWEDPRNQYGGAWTFRVPKSSALEFWKEIQMMAIGEIIQEVVKIGDDICGVSISVRFNSHLIMVWNRDASNVESVNAILARILESLPEELRPPSANCYYKEHSSHKSFKASATPASTSTTTGE